MRIAVLSDIHSNLVALDAVLAAAGTVDAIWQLGDVVGYGPDPNGVVARLAERGATGVHLGMGRPTYRRRLHGSRMLTDAGRRHRRLYGTLRATHPALFGELRRHRAASDLPPLKRALYPVLYGSRPPLGLMTRVRKATQALRQ
jgi:hypothetical protein